MKTLPAAVGLGLRTAHWRRRSGIPQRWEAANLNGGSASSTPGGTHKRRRCPLRPPNVRWSSYRTEPAVERQACRDARVEWFYRCCCKSPRQHRGRTFIPASRVHPGVGTGEGYFGAHRQVVGRPTFWCSHRPISNRSRRVLAGWVYRVGNGWRQVCASAVEELLCQPASRAKLQLAPRSFLLHGRRPATSRSR